jgi:hypothetical protein
MLLKLSISPKRFSPLKEKKLWRILCNVPTAAQFHLSFFNLGKGTKKNFPVIAR